MVRTKVGFAVVPDTQDYYPSTSRSLGESGVAKIRLCYGTNGRVTESTLAETSGYSRLDDAAVRMGNRFRLKPGTADGKPEADCVVVPIRFSLEGTSDR